ncbi:MULTISPECIES: hypothetical protein [Paracoccaceae]|jgi:hypothetical protein|uniref:hypothetical protein n=1 Tax=Paracoccaceae TaxID=31989 RepID=UPI0018ACF249|nr:MULTISPECIES: hypothetical protein [Paracoccaceae]
MRNLLLSVALIAVPVAGFAAVEMWLLPAPASQSASAGLGDLAPFAMIVTDTQTIAATGDLVAAQTRITDLETAWDEAEPRLRAADANAWGVVDTAIDDALSALRKGTPSPVEVTDTLAALQETLAGPVAAAVTGAHMVNGIAVTDDTGHALPCEAMLTDLSTALGGHTATPEVADLQARALERCNADDDTRANAFTAQALALLKS